MNTWLKSILIGLGSAALGFFAFKELSLKNKKQLFTVRYLVKAMPVNQSPGTEPEISAKDVRKMSDISRQRIEAAGYMSTTNIADHGKLDITIQHVGDTAGLKQLITKRGNLQIREVYTLSEIPSFIEFRLGGIDKPAQEFSNNNGSVNTDRAIRLSDLPKPTVPDTPLLFKILSLAGDFAEIGSVNEPDTIALTKELQRPELLSSLPRDLRFFYGSSIVVSDGVSSKKLSLYAIKINKEDLFIDNNDIENASQDYDINGSPEVIFSFNSMGTTKWEMMTRKNTGRHLAIILDDIVVTAPRVNSVILGGTSTLSGGFTLEEAMILASQLKTGSLPGRLSLLEVQISPESNSNKGRIILTVLCLFVLGTGLSYYIFKSLKNN